MAVPFPAKQPSGYQLLDDDPVFDPARHLQLEMPAACITLGELGYGEADRHNKATEFAVSAPFRVLSDEGAAAMLVTCRRLRAFQRRAGTRIEHTTRGGCYRSRFLRDLCTSPLVTAHMSRIYGVDIAPHPMALHLGHLNYEPTDVGQSVDKWHHDTLPLDYVMMVTDPATLRGGEFEWFHGTKAQAAELAAQGQSPAPDRVRRPEFPGPGYAIALHGDMVVHRAAALSAPGERITMVNGYVATDTTLDVQSRTADLIAIDDDQLLFAEWARFAAWRSAGRLQSVIDELEFGATADQAAHALESAVADAQLAAKQMRAGPPEAVQHYE